MVSASLRQNRLDAEERNSQQYPHPENPGLIEGPDGYYDWAGRRLFLDDGFPDPGTPGAYRYQTRPDLCDLEAPDSDPASPRYEPPHLRHRPGDTFEIGGKPADPDDPGPYGTPGWRPDRRTGRHRRNELPDPIPPWEQDPQDNGGDRPLNSRDTWRRRSLAAADTRAEEPPPSRTDRPSPGPSRPERRGGDTEYRFSRLREDAWDRFMTDSAQLADAHHQPRTPTAIEREAGLALGLWLSLARWLIAVVKSFTAQSETAEPEAPRERVPRTTVPGNRHARMASALAGAQRARAETRAPASDYVLDWERRFDTSHQATGRLVRSAAWA